ncbi:MAG: protein-export membrane protein SecF [Patescibacteria group bacterium]|nr:MAG: protein-export membrane protein SecF [Patescibacteria group bacterium]
MIDFIKYKFWYFAFSLIIIVAGIYAIFNWGYNYSIEFTGGAKLNIKTKLNQDNLKAVFTAENIKIRKLRKTADQYNLETNYLTEQQLEKISQELIKKDKQAEIVGSEIIEASFSQDLKNKMIIATILAVLVILIYIAISFKSFLFALSAVIAALHDSIILFGVYSILSKYFGFEFDSLFLTAVLTTLSFSVHDTIVVFDKIREYHSLKTNENLEYSANKALTETMVRSLNNSMTIIFVLTSLIIFGGSTIKHFITALLIGTISGTYSSPFIAVPVFVLLQKFNNR